MGLEIKKGDKVVDLAAGWYGAAEYIDKHTGIDADVLLSVDFAKPARDKALIDSKKLLYIVEDVFKLNLPDNYFDLVIAGEFIEHLEEPEKLVKYMAKICKVGGRMNLTTLNTQCEQAKARTYPEHVWEFEPEELVEMFNKVGKTQYKLVGNYHYISCIKC